MNGPWQVAVEDDVYDDIDEDQYQEHVRKRREDNFIEDDGAHCGPLMHPQLLGSMH